VVQRGKGEGSAGVLEEEMGRRKVVEDSEVQAGEYGGGKEILGGDGEEDVPTVWGRAGIMGARMGEMQGMGRGRWRRLAGGSNLGARGGGGGGSMDEGGGGGEGKDKEGEGN